jgi:hypothetical protein
MNNRKETNQTIEGRMPETSCNVAILGVGAQGWGRKFFNCLTLEQEMLASSTLELVPCFGQGHWTP